MLGSAGRGEVATGDTVKPGWDTNPVTAFCWAAIIAVRFFKAAVSAARYAASFVDETLVDDVAVA